MDDAGSYDPEPRSAPDLAAPVAEAPLLAYRSALATSIGLRLYEIHQALGTPEPGAKPTALAGVIAEHLGEPRVAERLLAGLETGPRMAMSLFALTETSSWPMSGLSHALAALGVEPSAAVRTLLELGLLAARVDPPGEPVGDYARLLDPGEPRDALLFAHPAALAAARTVLPEGDRPPPSGPVQHVREADGLELILRLAAVWQRVEEGPLRQTQQGTLFKRDRERLEDDPVLAGPIADALEPLPDMVALWLGLAQGVGLLVAEPSGERIVAARPEFWSENAIHLPQMIAIRLARLARMARTGGDAAGGEHDRAGPPLSPAGDPALARRAPRGRLGDARRPGRAPARALARLGASHVPGELAAVRHLDAGPRQDGSRHGRGRGDLGGGRRRRPRGALAGPRVPARPGPRGGGDAGRAPGRPADGAGALHPGARASPGAAPELRAVPVRPAELRDDRLSTGLEPRC